MNERTTSKRAPLSAFAVALVFVVLVLMTGARRVSADTFTVTNLNDSGMGSLRQAILEPVS
jgi:hypothetical protein